MNQVRGAVSEPMRIIGRADAHAVGPSSQMNGTCKNDESGSQWAFEAIGRIAGSGIRPPTSAKIQTKSTSRRPVAASDLATST